VRTYLVVDDSKTIRLSVVKALQNQDRSGTILEAASEREAIARFMENPAVDIVFLDMVLENQGTAIDTARAMLAARPETRIVLVTGLAREHPDVVAAISAGAFHYLRKPIRESDVKTTLVDIESEQGNVGRIR
jgi:DNA-binding NtrC family response regulator